MKKCLLLIFLLSTSIIIEAQNLVGSWQESWKGNEKGGANTSLIFNRNGTMSIHIFGEGKLQDGNLASMTISIPGTYSRAGQMVFMDVETDKITVNFEYKNKEGKTSEEEQAALKIVAETYRKNLIAQQPKSATIKIKSLTANELIVEISFMGGEKKYKRVANQ